MSRGRRDQLLRVPLSPLPGRLPHREGVCDKSPWRDTATTAGPSGERGLGVGPQALRLAAIDWAPRGVVMSAASHQSTLYSSCVLVSLKTSNQNMPDSIYS